MPNIFFTKYQQVIAIIMGGLFLFFLNMFFGSPNYANAGSHSIQSSTSTSVFAYLQAAKVAQEAGQTERAYQSWLHAKRLNPALCKPAWLLPVSSTSFPVAMSERQLLLNQVSQLPDFLIKPKLEALLKANPLDKEVRSALLCLARRQGDIIAAQRHQSVLQPVTSFLPGPYVKLALLALVVGAILWCVFAPLPGPKPVNHCEGQNN